MKMAKEERKFDLEDRLIDFDTCILIVVRLALNIF